MRLLCSCFLRMCYCTQGRLHFCGYMRGSSQLSSGSSQLSSARALLCVSTLNRFDAVSAYMRKMDRYGLRDFLKISHIR